MKATALSAAALFVLGGCASTAGVAPVAQNDIDYQKVYLVEQWAKRNNAEVHWVNYPTKKRAAEQQ